MLTTSAGRSGPHSGHGQLGSWPRRRLE